MSTVEVSVAEDTAASTSETCEETTSSCGVEVVTRLQAAEVATAPDADKVQVHAADGAHCSRGHDIAVETEPDSSAVDQVTPGAEYRATANKCGYDAAIFYGNLRKSPSSPTPPAEESNFDLFITSVQ